jgi:hypothetical protein
MNSVNDFEKQLENFGQAINNLDLYLLQVAGPIVDRMKQRSPVDTGDLRNSIRAEVANNTLTFKMMFYGGFQNYGVRGTEDNKGIDVEFGVEPRPTNEPFYAFKSRRFGLTNRNFFNMNEMSDEVANYLADRLIEVIKDTQK